MAFDIDESDHDGKLHDGGDYQRLYPHYHAYEIFDALDIPPPLVVTINPISRNSQYMYEMAWTDEDHANPDRAYKEYEEIRRELTSLFGADPGFTNHVVRSPMYIAGHHRNDPLRSGSSKLINISKESLWHHAIWYQPRGYTLEELRGIVRYLQELHGITECLSADYHTDNVVVDIAKPIVSVKTAATRKTKNRPSPSYHRELAQTPASEIHKGHKTHGRNSWLFANVSMNFGYVQAPKYRATKDFDGFVRDAMAYALELNSQLASPLSVNEVKDTVVSVVAYCMRDGFYQTKPRTSAEACERVARRWNGHVTTKTRASKLGISRATYYRQGLRNPQRPHSSNQSSNPFVLQSITFYEQRNHHRRQVCAVTSRRHDVSEFQTNSISNTPEMYGLTEYVEVPVSPRGPP
jgi:hypothetical protein